MISTAELVLLLFALSSNLILLFFSIYVSILEGKEAKQISKQYRHISKEVSSPQ